MPLRRPRLSAAWLLVAYSLLTPAFALDPDDVAARLRKVGDAEQYKADAVIVLDQTDVTVRADGIGVSTSTRLVKVLREAAIAGQSVQRFGFDPNTNRIEVRRVRVHRADGTIEDVDVRSAIDQPETAWGIFWGSRQVLVPAPRLSVGDAIETVAVKTGFNVAYLAADPVSFGATSLDPPMPGHWYDEVEFWAWQPVIEKRYIVRMPKNKPLQFEVYNGEIRSSMMFDGDQIVYTFEKKDIKPHQSESRSLSTRDTECKLVLATLEDWQSKSRWFHEKNEPSFAVDEAIRAKVNEIIVPLKTDEEKITALNHWVAENIRYIGTSRGVCEGYTTHPAIETFHDRGGVCKDKAGMLVAMLRVAGFDSYIVMTQAGTDVMPVPADQFNHAVTCIRKPDGGFRLLDPTWMPKSRENWSSAEQLQYVVYGTPQGEPLSQSPYSGPEENVVSWKCESRLLPDGALESAIAVSTVGAPETALRRALHGRESSQRQNYLAEAAARFGPATRLLSAKALEPTDFGGPQTLEVRFSTDGYAVGDVHRRFFTLPSLQKLLADVLVGDVLGANDLASRTKPLRLRSTRRMVFEESLRLPDGWKLVKAPEPVSIDTPAAGLHLEVSESTGQIRYSLQVDIKKHRVEPAEYAGLKQVLDKLDELTQMVLVCSTEAASARR